MFQFLKRGKLPEVRIQVCGHRRRAGHPRGSCGEKGGQQLFEAFQEAVEKRGLGEKVQVTSSKCLKACAFGPTVLVNPLGVWYGHVQLTDVSEVLEAALEGKQIARLKLLPEAISHS